MASYDPYLRHKIFGGLGLGAVLLVFASAYLIGRHHGESQFHVQQRALQRDRLEKKRSQVRECKSTLLRQAAGGDTAEGQTIIERKLREGLLHDEERVKSVREALVTCQTSLMESRAMHGEDDVSQELKTLRYQSSELEEAKSEITTEKKKRAAELRRKVQVLSLENEELMARIREMRRREKHEQHLAEEAEAVQKRVLEEEMMKQQKAQAEKKAQSPKQMPESGMQKDSDDEVRPPTPKPCVDRNEDCAAWAKDGECTANAKFMKISCRKSCGLCQPAQA